jgi:predicted nuclease of predicted toxin-antitoxin system
LKLLTDENIEPQLVRGLLRRQPDLDILRVQDVGLRGLIDPTVLEWAAHEGRVLITYDVSTMPDFAYQRVAQDQVMTGVIAIR